MHFMHVSDLLVLGATCWSSHRRLRCCSNSQIVNTGFGASEALVKNLTRMEQTGKAETMAVHILHVGDLIVIGAIMLVVTLVLTLLRNLALGSGEHRMTVIRAMAQVVVLLLSLMPCSLWSGGTTRGL